MSDVAASPRRTPGQAPLATTSAITTGGSLWWLGIVWVITLVVFAIVLVATSVNDADIEDSLWQGIGAGWQRWVVLGAGWSMVPSFARMLMTHGVTRLRLAQSAIVAGAIISMACAAFVVLGYGIEDVVFDRNDWPHVLDSGEAAGGVSFLLQAWMEVTVTVAAYFVTGWLIGISVYHYGKELGILLVIPCALPALAVELLVHSSIGNFGFGFVHDALDALGEPSAAVGVPLALVVLTAAAAAATRATRAIELKG